MSLPKAELDRIVNLSKRDVMRELCGLLLEWERRTLLKRLGEVQNQQAQLRVTEKEKTGG